MNPVDAAIAAFRAVDEDLERLVDALMTRSRDELVHIATNAGVTLSSIEARVKIIRRAYDTIGTVQVPRSPK